MSGATQRKKSGRKASGIRDLSPDAARLAISLAALDAVQCVATPDELHRAECAAVKRVKAAVALSDRQRAATGMAGGLPTLERLLREDIFAARVSVPEDGCLTFRPALRSANLEEQLLGHGFEKRLAWTAERFVQDVEACTVGKLTASYGEGLGGGSSAEPQRLVVALDRLRIATKELNRQERTAVWAVLVFGLSMTDTGWALAGKPFGHDPKAMRNAAWLFLDAALERMAVHYEAIGER